MIRIEEEEEDEDEGKTKEVCQFPCLFVCCLGEGLDVDSNELLSHYYKPHAIKPLVRTSMYEYLVNSENVAQTRFPRRR